MKIESFWNFRIGENPSGNSPTWATGGTDSADGKLKIFYYSNQLISEDETKSITLKGYGRVNTDAKAEKTLSIKFICRCLVFDFDMSSVYSHVFGNPATRVTAPVPTCDLGGAC